MENIIYKFGDKEYEFKLEKSWRKSLSISFDRNGNVIIKSPKLYPKALIEKFLKSKSSWINKKLLYFEKNTEKLSKKEYKKGEVHHYLGKAYSLELVVKEKDNVRIVGDNIVVSSKRVSPAIVKSLLTSWYHTKGAEILSQRYELAKKVFEKMSIYPESLTYKKMKGKWGYCTNDNHIFLNPELVKTPLECIDYVVYHEICHVRHHNHSREFHKLQKKMLPDYKIRKKKLNTFSS